MCGARADRARPSASGEAPSFVGLTTVFGAGGATSAYVEAERADLLVLWGSNARETHPIFFHHGLQGSSVAPGCTRSTRAPPPRGTGADAWLGLDVGTDVALADAVGREIIHAGLVNRAFVDRATTGRPPPGGDSEAGGGPQPTERGGAAHPPSPVGPTVADPVARTRGPAERLPTGPVMLGSTRRMVSLTLDGDEVRVPEGSTILTALHDEGSRPRPTPRPCAGRRTWTRSTPAGCASSRSTPPATARPRRRPSRGARPSPRRAPRCSGRCTSPSRSTMTSTCGTTRDASCATSASTPAARPVPGGRDRGDDGALVLRRRL